MTFHECVEAAIRTAAPGAHIRAETRGGDHVTLWGSAESSAILDGVEQAVWAVPGVCNVESHLTLRPPVEAVE